MKTLLSVILTLQYATSVYPSLVTFYDDVVAFTYYDAAKKCHDEGKALAKHNNLVSYIQVFATDQNCKCGWTFERFAAFRVRCGTFDAVEECEDLQRGVSSTGLGVFCQDGTPVDMTNNYNYRTVFVPGDGSGAVLTANHWNDADDVCSQAGDGSKGGAARAWKSQVLRYNSANSVAPFSFCDCSWTKKNTNSIWQANCGGSGTMDGCAYQAGYHPVYCLGVPKVPAVNECATNNGGCAQVCMDQDSGFTCSCNSGYQVDPSDSSQCVASSVNECDTNNGGCAQICTDLASGHVCSCTAGYQVNPTDASNCIGVNECATNNGGCTQICSDHTPGYTCSCNSGYQVDPNDSSNCVGINECATNNGGCEQICTDSSPGHTCSCNSGYQVDPNDANACIGVDECSVNNGGCADICTDLTPGFVCSCSSGYDVDPSDSTQCVVSGSCPDGLVQNSEGVCTDFIIYEDASVRTYYDALVKCTSHNLVMARVATLSDKIDNGQLAESKACGWTYERYDTYKIVCSAGSCAVSTCEAADWKTGVTSTGRIVYCQTPSPTTGVDMSVPYSYQTVFSPAGVTPSSVGAAATACAEAARSGVTTVLPWKSQVLRYNTALSGFASCDCSWTKKNSQLWQANCGGSGLMSQCSWAAGEHPVICLGVPKVPAAVDECATNNGGCAQVCTSLSSGVVCSCDSGYQVAGDPTQCENIDECSSGSVCTGQYEVCNDLPGTYDCSCQSGYSQDAQGNCQPGYVDPCDGTNPQEIGGVAVSCRNGNILIQRNAPCGTSGRITFDKLWADYKAGFGSDQNTDVGYWKGLEFMHTLTTSDDYRLIIEMQHIDGNTYWAYYDNFVIESEANGYRMTVGTYSGTGGDAFNTPQYNGEIANGCKFTTSDVDNDSLEDAYFGHSNCAKFYGAGWWFNHCHRGLLNGPCDGEATWWPLMTGTQQWYSVAWWPDNQKRLDGTYMMLKKM